MTKGKAARIGKMEARFRKLGAELDKVIAQAKEAGSHVKAEYHNRSSDFNQRRKLARSKLNKIKTTGRQSWSALKTGIDSAWNDLESAFREVKRTTKSASARASKAQSR